MPKNRAIRRFLGIFSFSFQFLTRILTANPIFLLLLVGNGFGYHPVYGLSYFEQGFGGLGASVKADLLAKKGFQSLYHAW